MSHTTKHKPFPKRNAMNNNRGAQQPQTIQFDSNDCNQLVCKECGYDGFEFEFAVIEIPYIYQAHFPGQKNMNIQYYRCMECGHRHALDELETITPKNKEMDDSAVNDLRT
jgi:DNA-directed RNA polymerase subunit RPC12/RpoP